MSNYNFLLSCVSCLAAFLFLKTTLTLALRDHFTRVQVFPHFIHLIVKGVGGRASADHASTVDPFRTLFATVKAAVNVNGVINPNITVLINNPKTLI